MIPVPALCLEKVDLTLNPTDSKPTRDYKNLMIDQVSWCTHNKDRILEMAHKLHQVITQGRAYPGLEQRCCKFALNERRYHDYFVEQGLASKPVGEAQLDKQSAVPESQDKMSVIERLEQAKETLANRKMQVRDIYQRSDRSYWAALDEQVRQLAAEEGLFYVRNDDSTQRPFEASPIVVNYFFHEEIIPSAKKKT